jgi:hypothetical protein
MQFIDLSAINKEAVLAALDSGFNDFEDALQHFSALKEKAISAIITRNIKDYRKSNLSVMTPETFLKTIQF